MNGKLFLQQGGRDFFLAAVNSFSKDTVSRFFLDSVSRTSLLRQGLFPYHLGKEKSSDILAEARSRTFDR